MQKRRVNLKTSNSSSELPVTVHDTSSSSSRSSSAASAAARSERRANRKSKKQNAVFSFVLFVIFVIMLGLVLILLTDFDYVSHHPAEVVQEVAGVGAASGNSNVHANSNVNPPLAFKFPSLTYAIDHSHLVGIYFAASWCSMSTPISNKIEELFSSDSSPMTHRVLSPLADEDAAEAEVTGSASSRKDFALVYVSSDDSEMEMMDYIRNNRSNWITVPYDSPDRTGIKQHFRICAQVEMESLGIERRRQEIPSLVIVDSATQGILTMGGKDDLLEFGEGVLDHWISMRNTVRAALEE